MPSRPVVRRTRSKSAMNRRAMLRAMVGGGTLAVGLPLLECMLDASGTAHADGSPLRTFFGIWFCGNGVEPSAFIPAGQGSAWTLPPPSERDAMMRVREPESTWADAAQYYQYPDEEHAFAGFVSDDLRQRLSIVTGLRIPEDFLAQHRSGQACVLSGGGLRSGAEGTHMAAPTADQLLAELRGGTPLVLEVDHGVAQPDIDAPIQRWLSWRNAAGQPPVPVLPYRDALGAFEGVFGGAALPSPSSNPAEGDARRSVIDHVRGQLTQLASRVSAQDRARLDQHFTALRELEDTLARQAALCAANPPLALSDVSTLESRNQAMVMTAALALSCGAHDIFHLTFSVSGSVGVIPGAPVGQHGLQHQGFLACGLEAPEKLRAAIAEQGEGARKSRLETMPLNRRAVRYEMDRFRDLLRHFAEIPHGAGTLLDACAILGTFEMWDGNHHGYDETPLLIAGGANGRLRTGVHVRDAGSNPAEVTLTAMRAAAGDVLVPSLGPDSSASQATLGYSALEI